MKSVITPAENLQLQGLILLALKSVRHTDEIMREVATLLGMEPTRQEDEFCDLCDPVWGKQDEAADQILLSFGIRIEPKGGAQ